MAAKQPKRDPKPRAQAEQTPAPALSEEQQELVRWLKTVKFRKAIVGGVDEADLWKKLEQLNHLYEAALAAERARYNALMNAYVQSTNAKLDQYRQALDQSRSQYEQLAQAYHTLLSQNKERESDG